jgi:hypothetical protein
MELDEIRSLGNDFLSNIQRLQTTRAINEANQVENYMMLKNAKILSKLLMHLQ